ncbi:MAG TPA: hypothetical protein VGB03_00725, partial [Acidimicrobiales bacterium]
MSEIARKAAAVVFAVAAVVLLLSPGGAGVIAAPVLLPLCWWFARRGSGVARAGFLVLAGAVAALVTWAGVYVLADGEPQPEIVVFPAGAALLTIAFLYERVS